MAVGGRCHTCLSTEGPEDRCLIDTSEHVHETVRQRRRGHETEAAIRVDGWLLLFNMTSVSARQ